MIIPVEQYILLRDQLAAAGYSDEYLWCQSVKPPSTADDMAGEMIWIICCSGFREQAARVTQRKVMAALASGRPATDAFPRSGKGRAIDTIWTRREELFREFCEIKDDGLAVLQWIPKLPFVGGPTLRFHAAKNLGFDVAKPDRWLCRIAGVPESAPTNVRYSAAMAVCRPLAEATGDRIATVDLILWRACNVGLLNPIARKDAAE